MNPAWKKTFERLRRLADSDRMRDNSKYGNEVRRLSPEQRKAFEDWMVKLGYDRDESVQQASNLGEAWSPAARKSAELARSRTARRGRPVFRNQTERRRWQRSQAQKRRARAASAARGSKFESLSEAVARFRDLTEAVKVGDYVTTKDGKEGYVTAVYPDKVAFNWVQYKQTKQIFAPKATVNVNPGGPPR